MLTLDAPALRAGLPEPGPSSRHNMPVRLPKSAGVEVQNQRFTPKGGPNGIGIW